MGARLRGVSLGSLAPREDASGGIESGCVIVVGLRLYVVRCRVEIVGEVWSAFGVLGCWNVGVDREPTHTTWEW